MRVLAPEPQPPQQVAAPDVGRPGPGARTTDPAAPTPWTSRRMGGAPPVEPRRRSESLVGIGSGDLESGHEFSRIRIYPDPLVEIQAKLAVTASGDRFEEEADRVSERVLRMAGPERRRACDCGGTCAKCQAAESDPEPKRVQTRRVRPGEAGPSEAPPIVHEVLAAPGQPLDPSARALMEPRFGHDFSKLRVHADARAAAAAGEIGARAFTAGRHIVFGRGQYAPGSPTGQRLLAHELTHVLQQTQPAPLDGVGPEAAQPLSGSEVIQRQPADAPPVDAPPEATPPEATPPLERKKIRKIILDKRQGVQMYELEPEGVETIAVMDHCNPRVGSYTARIRQSPERPEALDWVTDQDVGCEVKKGYIAKTTEARKIGTLVGVTAIEFEVRDEAPGAAGGENVPGKGAGGTGPGDQPGGATQAQAAEGPRGVREIWREITALPLHIQEFLVDPRSNLRLSAADYEIVLRVGEKLAAAGVSAEELFEFRRGAAVGVNFSEFETTIDGFLTARAEKQAVRAQNLIQREKTRTALFDREALYKRYLDLRAQIRKAQALAAVAGTTIQQTGVDPALIKVRDKLNADLIQAGFPGGISEFERHLRDFEAAFERETLAIAFDLIRQYEYLLAREYAQFEGGKTGPKSEAATLLKSLGNIREPAQALYELARQERSAADRAAAPRGRLRGGERLEGDHEKAAALRRAAAQHETEAEALVVGAAPDLPVIAWQDFPREKLVGRTSPEAVRYEVAWYLATHEAAVRRARALLKAKPEHIYELDNLLALSYALQDIEKNSLPDLIIKDRRSRIKSDKSARDILIAVLTIALAIVSFGGGAVGLIAAGAAFGIGAAQAVSELKEYDTKTTLYLAQLLKDEPSAAWAIMAVIGAGLDAGGVIQALKVVAPAAKAFNASQDLAALGKSISGVDPRVSERVMRAAEQAQVAEKQLKAAADDLKTVFTSPGKKLRSVGLPGGELLGHLVAITYYYLKTRVLRSFRRFIDELEKDGLVVWAKLSADEQLALRQAFDHALQLTASKQLPYGAEIYRKLSPRAQAAFPAEATDRFAAQGKALGKSDQEIIDALEAEAKAGKLPEGAGEERLLDPSEVDDVRDVPNISVSAYDATIGDSAQLGANLTAAGRPNPRAGFPRENFQAHHIIPSNEGPEELRTLLRKHDLDINGEFNGVWLPTGNNAPNPTGAMRHQQLTGNQEYFARLRAILLKEPPLTKEQVIEKLRAIATYLDRGKFPPPRL